MEQLEELEVPAQPSSPSPPPPPGGVLPPAASPLLAHLARVDFLQHDEKGCVAGGCTLCELLRERRRLAPSESDAWRKSVRRLERALRAWRPRGIPKALLADMALAAAAQLAPRRFRRHVVQLAARGQQDGLLLGQHDALRNAPVFAAFLRPGEYNVLRRISQRLEEWSGGHARLASEPYAANKHVAQAGRGEQCGRVSVRACAAAERVCEGGFFFASQPTAFFLALRLARLLTLMQP